ncbi:Anaerobic dehydrogenases typically selenocysteine-containing-like protein [Candidatus Sulfopaludibacter sp. SbA4]|nr:Anaerobic dehydrogenases typically selenocysteine-containing-like protein [Candidatus Sulfopaludibacter sp. SbA4]
MTTTRRDIFKFAGGSALGALLTPAPWRLITDTALWSENWPGIPRPARGEIRAKFTHCSLCPAGCAVRARCVGEQPVSLAGVRGGLCPFGVTGHQLPYHPARLRQGPVSEAMAAVADAIAKCGPGERVAVLDLRPGRTASWTARRAMAVLKNGWYIAPVQSPVAVDLTKARTVLSLSAPLLERWGTPANVFAVRDGFRLIQADPVESRTAALADLWLPIRPGSEEALALGLAGQLTSAETAAMTGLSEHQIESVGQTIGFGRLSLVIDRAMSPAVVALNVKLGGWGRTIVPRAEAPVPPEWKKAAPVTDLAAVPDRSIRVLLIDESAPGEYLPWDAIEKKLAAGNPLVVVFAWSANGYGRYAKYVLPTPVYPEATDDIPPAIDSPAPCFRIAAPLLAAPAGVVTPSEFIASLAGLPPADALRERARAIHQGGRGTLVTYADAKSVPVKEVKPDDFWKALNAGGCWVGQALPPANFRAPVGQALPPANPSQGLVVLATPPAPSPASPLFTKLYQESDLLLAPNCIALHPQDAARCGVSAGNRATLETPNGKWSVRILTDSSVRPGVVLAARPEMASASGKVVRV